MNTKTSWDQFYCLGFEVMKSYVFWYVTPCSVLKVNCVSSIFRFEELGKQETVIIVGGKQSSWVADILD